MPDVCGMVLGVDVVVLQYAVRVEVVHKPLVLEVFVDVLELGLVERGGLVLCSCSGEFAPLRLIGQFLVHSQVIPGGSYQQENNGIGPCAVDIVDQVDVGMVEIATWDIIRIPVVISAKLDNHQVCRLFCRHVDFFRVISVHLLGTSARV